MEFVADTAREMNVEIGRHVILPSTFQGSPRHMQQQYQDAMAIVSECGTPDVFLTFTCNPKWREINENLYEGEKVEDRPDLVARVFRLKLKALKKMICDEGYLGFYIFNSIRVFLMYYNSKFYSKKRSFCCQRLRH